MVRNVAISCYFVWHNAQTLKTAVTANTSFKDFYNRKDQHVNDNKILTLICSNLPSLAFRKVEQAFYKNFTHWFKWKASLCLVASEFPFSQMIYRHSLDLPISFSEVRADFSDKEVDLLLLYSFLVTNVDAGESKQSKIYKKYNSTMTKIANGSYLFDSSSTDSDLIKLASCTKSNMLSISANR